MRIVHGKLITCEGEFYEDGFVSFENGKFTAFGDAADMRPEEGDIDVRGMWIAPGL